MAFKVTNNNHLLPQRYSLLIILILTLLCTSCSKQLETVSKYISVKEFGAVGNGLVDESAAFAKAQKYASENHLKILVPIGVYKVDLSIQYDSLEIEGEKNPMVSDTSLYNGTIILGSINAKNKKHFKLSNLGIWSTTDALVCGDGLGSEPLYQYYSDITLLGTGFWGYKHGFLCQSGSNIEINNFTVNKFFHGIALRCSNVNVSNITANKCGFTSIVVKSATGGNNLVENVKINNVVINGDQNDAYSMGGIILIQSYDDACVTKNITVNNVKSTYGGVGAVIVQQLKGSVDNVSITNCNALNTGDNPIRASFGVEGGASNITFTNCLSTFAKGTAFKSDPLSKNVRVVKCFENNSGVAPYEGKFSYLELNNQVIIK
jgi:hypothetical protein